MSASASHDKIVRIGGASGFWGDSEQFAVQLANSGQVDYLIFDYLAEITMSLLARVMARKPELGYVPDLVDPVMKTILRTVADRGIRIIANAGGINPAGCRDALLKLAAEQGIDIKVAAVLGDNLAGRADEFRAKGIGEMETGAPLPEQLMSMNAYLGARPIAQALDAGAQIVVTGRCADSALALGALVHEFGWRDDDYDLLAAGSLCGHLVECNAQVTGGGFTDWELVEGFDNMGSPIAECKADGSFIITKTDGTGGLVVPAAVCEQMLYEIGDPRAYLLPDVAADFTGVTMEQVGPHRVLVQGAKGRPPTDTYKVSCTYQDGWRAMTVFTQAGGKAGKKGRVMAEAILARCRRILAERGLPDFSETSVEILGAEDTYAEEFRQAFIPREVQIKIGVKHPQKEALETFAREIFPSALSMPPGMTGITAGRPAPQPVVRLFSCLINKADVPVHIEMDGTRSEVPVPAGGGFDPATLGRPLRTGGDIPDGPRTRVPLVALAYGRSGDKGDHANIGLIARRPEYVPYLREVVTEALVARYFAHVLKGKVERWELPGTNAFNFLLHNALGGGGVASLRIDPQAKTWAQMLLDLPVEVPEAWVKQHDLPPAASA